MKRICVRLGGMGVVTGLCATLSGPGCGDGLPEPTVAVTQASHIGPSLAALKTYTSRFVQIDQLALATTPPCGNASPCLDPQDANLLPGADVDSPSVDCPSGGPLPYWDWNDFMVSDPDNHFVIDYDAADGKDLTAFPGSNECVGKGNVHGKHDIRYVAAANNMQYAYFAGLRRSNQGDAALVWLLTMDPPIFGADGAAPCGPNQQQLMYHLDGSSVLLRLQFHTSSNTPAMATFKTAAGTNTIVTALQAMDFTSSLWVESNVVAAAAVNTTLTNPGALGTMGASSLSGGHFQEWLFVEGAVPMTAFANGTCDVSYYATVTTRASGSGAQNPDPKDVLFTRFNFGSPSATASLSATCDTLHYALTSATSMDGSPLVDPTCSWTFHDSSGAVVATLATCTGDLNLPPGSYTGVVVVSGPSLGSCTATVADLLPVAVYGPLSLDLTAGPVDACTSDAVTYTASAAGGSGPGTYSYGWTEGSGCSSTSATCTIDPQSELYCSTATLNVTVDDQTTCPPVTSPTWQYGKTTTVTTSVVP